MKHVLTESVDGYGLIDPPGRGTSPQVALRVSDARRRSLRPSSGDGEIWSCPVRDLEGEPYDGVIMLSTGTALAPQMTGHESTLLWLGECWTVLRVSQVSRETSSIRRGV